MAGRLVSCEIKQKSTVTDLLSGDCHFDQATVSHALASDRTCGADARMRSYQADRNLILPPPRPPPALKR